MKKFMYSQQICRGLSRAFASRAADEHDGRSGTPRGFTSVDGNGDRRAG
jgi:hypothetical protein